MDFTREPIIETVITPREGYRLVVRNSKSIGEEHFVDAVEVVSFGNAFFFRSVEKPKPFLMPVGDYEVLEVRESRMVLKTPHAQAGSIKIGASKEAQREHQREARQQPQMESDEAQNMSESLRISERGTETELLAKAEGRHEKRRDRRKTFRRRRGQFREESKEGAESANGSFEETEQQIASPVGSEVEESFVREEIAVGGRSSAVSQETIAQPVRTFIPPPSTLIRDDLQRLRDNEMYRGAFFLKDEKEQDDDDTSLESFAAEASSTQFKGVETQEGVTKESSPEEPFLFEQAIENDIDRDIEDPLSR